MTINLPLPKPRRQTPVRRRALNLLAVERILRSWDEDADRFQQETGHG